MSRPIKDEILKILRSNNVHLTADQIYLKLKDIFPRLSLASVYRNLESLCRSGDAGKISIEGQAARYESWKGDHYHIHCTNCGRIEDVAIDNALLKELSKISVLHGYRTTSLKIDFFGICDTCNKEKDLEHSETITN